MATMAGEPNKPHVEIQVRIIEHSFDKQGRRTRAEIANFTARGSDLAIAKAVSRTMTEAIRELPDETVVDPGAPADFQG